MRNLLTHITLFAFIILSSPFAWGQASGPGIGDDNGGPKQSWQDIYNNPNLRPEFPKYIIEERKISFHNLCLVGERIRTKYKHVVSYNVSKFFFDYLYTDRIYEREDCLEWDRGICVNYQLIKVEIPLKQGIKVLKKTPGPAQYLPTEWLPAFEKEYELKTCPEIDKFPESGI